MLLELNLSHNELTGSIPASFKDLQSLSVIDLSYNDLEGPLPDSPFFRNASVESFVGNKGLCGHVRGFPLCGSSSRARIGGFKVVLVVVIPILGVLVFLSVSGVLLFCYKRRRNREKDEGVIREGQNSIWTAEEKISYEDIIKATDNFDETHWIGSGGYGNVYKAKLSSGLGVAVKKLHPLEGEQGLNEKTFMSEIKALTELRHRNIVKFYGSCLSPRSMFLVYEYVENGSLSAILRDGEAAMKLKWNERLSIIKDVANALSYMHHDCVPPIVHRDIRATMSC
ncbi:putative LRR receptor-like serine/threonine-protein kinase [Acorus calamus]|uniref:non-specific serine/threonine protein kinase n=1 Tax=Acorus calamus TaxID=4465 RepID=A0AAV9E457_ACOCL|nr:putative LRR receptor-like serine/threonine-protein kinase [Acorus calamus]